MDVAFVFFVMIAQPIIIGYISQKQIQRPGAGIFFGIVAFVLSCFVVYLCMKTVRRTFLADGIVTTGLGGMDGLFISVGVSSAIVLAIVSILRNKSGNVSGSMPCPFCAERIKREAIVCKHCGRDLPQVSHRLEAPIR